MATPRLDVLIVDDHEGMRVLLRAILERAGVARVRDAANGADALALIAEAPPSLILVDQRMPGMDGPALVARVRADEACAATRIIMISGAMDGPARDAAIAAGADAALAKPVSPRALLAEIEKLFAA